MLPLTILLLSLMISILMIVFAIRRDRDRTTEALARARHAEQRVANLANTLNPIAFRPGRDVQIRKLLDMDDDPQSD